MKPTILFLLLFITGLNCSAQNFHLQLIGSSTSESEVIDSLKYISTHKDAKNINDEINLLSEKLTKIGFLENIIIEKTKEKDSTYIGKFSLGKRIKSIHIYIGRNSALNSLSLFSKKKDTLIIPYPEVETFLNQSLQKTEERGFAFAKLKLVKIQRRKNILYAELQFESEHQRQLNAIVIKYTQNQKNTHFPKGHLAQINHKYRNKIFNQDIVSQIHSDFDKFGFTNQVKYPEILFTKDTTKVYVYLEKRKSNNFDGFIGFSNNENKKIVFNGYLDLTLENTLQAGEEFSLYWKSDGNKQKTFRTSLELPYLFKSPIGLKAQINIFKQDSTYQNTKTAIDLGYYINYNTRLYLGYQSTESSDIQNTNSNFINDYKNSFITSNLEYSKSDYNNTLFSNKTSVSIKTGIGKRETNNPIKTIGTKKQFFIDTQAMHTFYLNKKNSINIKNQNHYLKSETYLANELFRFGGINSIRGFKENSLQANFTASILTEYRYAVSPALYLHTITDYSLYFDPASSENKNRNQNLLSIGLGIGLKTKSGLLQLSIANGSSKNQEIDFYNTILRISYNVKF